MIDPFQIATLLVDPSSRRIMSGAAETTVSPRAMGVLNTLRQSGMKVVSRDALLDAVWSDVTVTDESLTQAVAELRRAFVTVGADQGLVVTVPKSGYRLAAEPVRAPVLQAEPTRSSMIEALVFLHEARRLVARQGHCAARDVVELVREAEAAAPEDAAILAQVAKLRVIAAASAGDSARWLAAAAQTAEKAVRLRPDVATSHMAAGLAAAALGRETACRAAFSRALSLAPGNAEVHYFAAHALFRFGDARSATALGERAAALGSEAHRPLFVAARASLALGDAQRARAAARAGLARVEAALSNDPASPRFVSARAAFRAMADGANLDSDTPGLSSALAPYFYDVLAQDAAGRPEQALEALEALVDDGWRNGSWLRAEPLSARLRKNRRFQRLASALCAA